MTAPFTTLIAADELARHLGDRDWFLPSDTVHPSEAIDLPAEAGDVIYFGARTVHGSGTNTSTEARTTWLIQMRDPADRPTVDRHRSPGQVP